MFNVSEINKVSVASHQFRSSMAVKLVLKSFLFQGLKDLRIAYKELLIYITVL